VTLVWIQRMYAYMYEFVYVSRCVAIWALS